MRLTIKTQQEHYVDILIEPSEKIIYFLSPIPEITEEDLEGLCDSFGYTIRLPITGEQLRPEPEKLATPAQLDFLDQLIMLLSVMSFVITDK